MKAIQRVLIALTVANLGLLIFVLVRIQPTAVQGVAPVLRGRALEIVDGQGRVRASITIHPSNPTVRMANGTPYPETTIIRVIDPNGRPVVKLGGSEQASGLSLLGESDPTHVILKSEGTITSLKLRNNDGREQLINP
jgi:hypothetical protein